ncbi:SDR family oxidoreductase [Curvibacter sp. HBC61]|uniref:SDR family oxidoreductase n=1 Tax=Curvibacter cyanobacteriorum TaxID=3026422 RepID=A0ABT5MVY3_9BURK|nr:SDR family oxidoreductase [Curvibacter sp. HBC61]MDD0838216.1 SDR family oxidoreductase [Curvibacter sp. HBC61]
MSPHSPTAAPSPLLLIGTPEPLTEVVHARLSDDGHGVLRLDTCAPHAVAERLLGLNGLAALVLMTPTALSHRRFEDITDADFETALEQQLFSVVRVVQQVLPHLSSGAQIVHVGSRGHLGAWGGVHQMAASAALAAMSRSMALELQAEGISVNLVAAEFAHERQDSPENRGAVAHAVSLFAAPTNRITGQHLVIDGLSSLRMSEARRHRF